MDMKNTSDEELCQLYSKHLLSNLPNMITIGKCANELRNRRLKVEEIHVSVKFSPLDGSTKPITIRLTDGVIKELWLRSRGVYSPARNKLDGI